MLVNGEYFREDAKYFEQHRRYDDGEYGTEYYDKFWRERIKRSIYGYQVGDTYISGYHYFFLNMCPIERTKKTYGTIHKDKATTRQQADRVTGFPDMWDANYDFFMYCELAENGLKNVGSLEYIATDLIDKLYIDYFDEEEYLNGGWDAMYLKPRGVGASFMGGSMPARNFFCIPGSRSIIVADDKQFLNKDGVYSKFLSYLAFINDHTGLSKSMDIKKSPSDMHFRASYINQKTGSEASDSFGSEVLGLSLKNDTEKIRGKRSKIILYEEIGTFTDFKRAWQISDPGVRKKPISWGMRLGYGTGGTEGAKFESMKSMVYNPLTHNIFPINNVWDEGRFGKPFSLFTPATYNFQLMDEEGNSLREEALAIEEKEREKQKLSDDPDDLTQYCAENPLKPKEAMMGSALNIFRPEYISDLINFNDASGYTDSLAIIGELHDHGLGNVSFQPNPDLRPFYDYPVSPKKKRAGAVIQYDVPWRHPETKEIPPHLHYICVDPYNFDDAPTSSSVGAIYVIRNINNFAFPDDTIVASYIGRPATTDEFNRILFMLSDYYNAYISFENEGSDIIAYAKRHNKIHRLFPELSLDFNESISSKGALRRGFGVKISSGKNNTRKKFGDSYLAEWLYTERGVTEDGKIIYNIDRMPDPGLLKELEIYDPEDGNFDRISALRVGMFFKRELEWKNKIPNKQSTQRRKSESRFFSSTLRNNNKSLRLPKGTAMSDVIDIKYG